MRVEHGCSFETIGGVWRKERLDAEVTEFPEAATLPEESQVPYVAARLEQRLLYLRWMFGNLNADQYRERHAAIEAMCTTWLTPVVEPEPAGV